MRRAGTTYTTFNKVRLALFTRSYAHQYISCYLKAKYKINDKLSSKELHKAYFGKRSIPEVQRLAKVLNFNYALLWNSILLDKNQVISKKLSDKDRLDVFLSIENEIKTLAKQKQNKSDYFDPDYDTEFALLSVAIERAVGNALQDIEDDALFDQQSETLKMKYSYWYYKMAYKYKLPTIRITPFIMRLITTK